MSNIVYTLIIAFCKFISKLFWHSVDDFAVYNRSLRNMLREKAPNVILVRERIIVVLNGPLQQQEVNVFPPRLKSLCHQQAACIHNKNHLSKYSLCLFHADFFLADMLHRILDFINRLVIALKQFPHINSCRRFRCIFFI